MKDTVASAELERADDPVSTGIHTLPLDAAERRAAARLLRIQAFGERIAMQGARGQARIAPTRDARRFLRRQSRQEAFHAWLFERAAKALWPEAEGPVVAEIPPALLRVRSRLFDAIARRSFAEAVVIQHVALEALGHAVLDRLDSELALMSNVFGRLRRIVMAQENAHCAFGERWLAAVRHEDGMRDLERAMMSEADEVLRSIAPLLGMIGGDSAELADALRHRASARREAAPR